MNASTSTRESSTTAWQSSMGDSSSVRRKAATALHALARTDDRVAPLVARVALGVVMLPHGLQKTVGWFGGYGFSATMDYFTSSAGLPWIVALAVILVESVGAAALIAGAGARLAAAAIAAVMIGAIVTVHLPFGFFMNWSGTSAGEGYEYHLLAIGLAAVVMAAGAGRASIDRAYRREPA